VSSIVVVVVVVVRLSVFSFALHVQDVITELQLIAATHHSSQM
jgi:hypothetical protein